MYNDTYALQRERQLVIERLCNMFKEASRRKISEEQRYTDKLSVL